MKSLFRALACMVVGLVVFPLSGEVTNGEKLFALKLNPFAQKCMACHGDDPKKIKGDLDMCSRESLFSAGNVQDEVLIPGKGGKLSLYSFHPGRREMKCPPRKRTS